MKKIYKQLVTWPQNENWLFSSVNFCVIQLGLKPLTFYSWSSLCNWSYCLNKTVYVDFYNGEFMYLLRAYHRSGKKTEKRHITGIFTSRPHHLRAARYESYHWPLAEWQTRRPTPIAIGISSNDIRHFRRSNNLIHQIEWRHYKNFF